MISVTVKPTKLGLAARVESVVDASASVSPNGSGTSPYGLSYLLAILAATRTTSGAFWLRAFAGPVSTKAWHVTQVSDIAAPLHQVHQTGFAQRARRSLYSWRMGSGAGRRSNDVPIQFHLRLNQAGDPEPRLQDR